METSDAADISGRGRFAVLILPVQRGPREVGTCGSVRPPGVAPLLSVDAARYSPRVAARGVPACAGPARYADAGKSSMAIWWTFSWMRVVAVRPLLSGLVALDRRHPPEKGWW